MLKHSSPSLLLKQDELPIRPTHPIIPPKTYQLEIIDARRHSYESDSFAVKSPRTGKVVYVYVHKVSGSKEEKQDIIKIWGKCLDVYTPYKKDKSFIDLNMYELHLIDQVSI